MAAVGDLHCTKTSLGAFHPMLEQAAADADVLLLAGDLTDNGMPDEARVLVKELTPVHVPIVAVLGNHDFESGKADEVRQILVDAGVSVLDGEACEVHGVGIAGVKGFCGGFGQRALGAWGEDSIKHFVREAVDEALKLETALARVRTLPSVALLHYSPVQGTVEGEPLEIYPFLGSSRLEEPINTYPRLPRHPQPRAPGPRRGHDEHRRPRLQRLDAAARAHVQQCAAVPRLRDSSPRAIGRRRRCRTAGRRQAPIAVSCHLLRGS